VSPVSAFGSGRYPQRDYGNTERRKQIEHLTSLLATADIRPEFRQSCYEPDADRFISRKDCCRVFRRKGTLQGPRGCHLGGRLAARGVATAVQQRVAPRLAGHKTFSYFMAEDPSSPKNLSVATSGNGVSQQSRRFVRAGRDAIAALGRHHQGFPALLRWPPCTRPPAGWNCRDPSASDCLMRLLE